MILVGSRKGAEKVMASVTTFLERRLKLRVNPKKSQVLRVAKLEFLGFAFHAGRMRISNAPMLEFRFRLKRYSCRNWFVSMEHRLAKLRRYVVGWMNYYGLSEPHGHGSNLTGWLYRRIRMCYWVIWRRPRTRIKRLLNLGVHLTRAVGLGRSSLWPWKCSRLLGLVLSPEWLAAQGVVSPTAEWKRCAHLR